MTTTTNKKNAVERELGGVQMQTLEGAPAMTIVHPSTDKDQTGRKWVPLTWGEDDVPSYAYHGNDPTATIAMMRAGRLHHGVKA